MSAANKESSSAKATLPDIPPPVTPPADPVTSSKKDNPSIGVTSDSQEKPEEDKNRSKCDKLPSNIDTIKSEKKLNLKALIKRHLQVGACKMEYEVSELHQLLDLAKASMQAMPMLVEVAAPVNVCGKGFDLLIISLCLGDIHGQYSDLMRIFIVNYFGPCLTSSIPFRVADSHLRLGISFSEVCLDAKPWLLV